MQQGEQKTQFWKCSKLSGEAENLEQLAQGRNAIPSSPNEWNLVPAAERMCAVHGDNVLHVGIVHLSL